MGRSLGGVLALTLSALKASAAPRNDHCFLDKVNETVLTTRDLLDWPLDPLRPWWTRAVDARIDPIAAFLEFATARKFRNRLTHDILRNCLPE